MKCTAWCESYSVTPQCHIDYKHARGLSFLKTLYSSLEALVSL